MYIITREINEYNQDGKYFVAAFTKLPTIEQLRKALHIPENDDKELETRNIELFNHILGGGGRRNYENEWYNLMDYTEYS